MKRLALTATAPCCIHEKLLGQLCMLPSTKVLCSTIYRPNIALRVYHRCGVTACSTRISSATAKSGLEPPCRHRAPTKWSRICRTKWISTRLGDPRSALLRTARATCPSAACGGEIDDRATRRRRMSSLRSDWARDVRLVFEKVGAGPEHEVERSKRCVHHSAMHARNLLWTR